MKTALISVSDKTNIEYFAQKLIENNYRLLSTGGTYHHLKKGGLDVTEVAEITGFPEILDGRVKTLHPHIHGGILARRSKPDDLTKLQELGIGTIDLVVVNLYPFFENADKNLTDSDLAEFIDIGGPTMLRSAAKSYFDVAVVTDLNDYGKIIQELEETKEISFTTRKTLAGKVFNLTSAYDAAIAKKLLNEDFPEYFNLSYKKHSVLRYGENPHQSAAYYTATTGGGSLKDFEQIQGKELSFNNLRDFDLAWNVVRSFNHTACCAVKHSTPCGVALDENLLKAYKKAHDADPISIFGGIVAFNRKVTKEVAEKCNEIFLEIVVAPDFEKGALDEFSKKKNLRLIKIRNFEQTKTSIIPVDGGLLVQDKDLAFTQQFDLVTDRKPTPQQLEDLKFALQVIKNVKSNAIVVANQLQTLGIGTGQTNRIWAAQQAINRAKEKREDGLVLASDAFFPFPDVVEYAAEQGVEAIIQPGGSLNDPKVIEKANELNIAMVVTGMRHFLH
ncbi:bifunctional phosphoribosylaminoimidazolecarboxamide formyltransferase/IMP cyclohydrolase [Candidatus Ornithobacterium hominis]|uniref:bifunctional phosphoribosylaminoimidazolecarboxamide formyltransferase/IMP cyclohydrolase n=1 Tax=Candidatus Ornithobacterium hominis TaxID=2497989 RepID=UPI0024BCD3F0|nr:bifunctional phosphoribosylaminoimidazolecarboxamide formyltransferase/IMP cyclohydrolase [Candidatus Ornithobacterium hominis]CAI9428689.1 bifunctional phosphoribosylaminoimidazolecarboxamide formyltransferase/IMP cyclohydrolase [Candidatus Ornithobacterium hominis]